MFFFATTSSINSTAFFQLVVLSALIYFFFCFIRSLLPQITKKQRESSSGKRVTFSQYAHLACMSYCTSSLASPRNQSHVEVVLPHLDHIPGRLNSLEINESGNVNVSVIGGTEIVRREYQVKGTYANNAIWLLRHVNAAYRNSWVVIFRGTKTIDDLVVDLSLVAAVACNDTKKFEAFLDRHAEQLTLEAFVDHGVRREHSITLIGHSLGASVAEAMLARLHHAGYNNVNACAFDSPGTPYDLRAKFPRTPWENLSILYSRDNPINNLCSAPSQAKTYLVSQSDPLELSNFASLARAMIETLCLRNVTAFVSLKSIFHHCVGPHSIMCLTKTIESGLISPDKNVSARQLSGMLLRATYRLYLSVRFTSSTASVAHSKDSDAVVPKKNILPSTAKLQHPEFPGADRAELEFDNERRVASIQKRRPKVLPYSVTDLSNFTRGMSSTSTHDIILPLIGLTSVGKSSLLKAILKLPPNDKTLPVGARMNLTVTPVVILWKLDVSENGKRYRVWLMDLPGVRGGSVTMEEEQSNPFLDVDIPTQLKVLRKSVQAACFVCGDNVLEEEKRLFIQAYEAVQGRILVAHNIKGIVYDDEQDLLTIEAREECRKALQNQSQEGGDDLRIVAVKVARTPSATKAHLASEYGIEALTRELFRSYTKWRDEIEGSMNEEREAARRAEIVARADEIERDTSYFRDVAAAGGTGVGVMAGTGGVGLGALGIAESVGAGITLAAGGPVVLCTAALFGVGGGLLMAVRRKQNRRKAAMEKAEKDIGDAE